MFPLHLTVVFLGGRGGHDDREQGPEHPRHPVQVVHPAGVVQIQLLQEIALGETNFSVV